MSMVRMFHVECDGPDHDPDWDDLGDEWYARTAVELAKAKGFHLKGDLAICPECWDAGVRFANLEATR